MLVLQGDQRSESEPKFESIMGNNVALLLVSLLVMLLSQAHRGQGYREAKWYDNLIHPTIDVVIGNMFDIPLKVECHS